MLGPRVTTGHISLRRPPSSFAQLVTHAWVPETKAEPSSQAREHPHPHRTHPLVPHSPLGFAQGERTQVELAGDTVGSAPDSYGTGPGNHLAQERPIKFCSFSLVDYFLNSIFSSILEPCLLPQARTGLTTVDSALCCEPGVGT